MNSPERPPGTRIRHVRIHDDLWRALEDRAALNGMMTAQYLRLLIAVDAGVAPPPLWFKPHTRPVDIFKQIERDLDRV